MPSPSTLLPLALTLTLLPHLASAVGRPLTCDKPPFNSLPFCNTSLPTTARVADALSRLTLQEKIDIMSRPFGSPFVPCHGTGGTPSLGAGGLPRYSECLHGVSTGCTKIGNDTVCPTLFPNGQLLGAAFNRSLWNAVGSVIGDEMRAIQNLAGSPSGYSCWSPNLNAARDPRWGRAQEVPGEDAFLMSEYGVAYVQGMQGGEDSRYIKTAASPKHFLAYDLEGLGPNNETGLCTADKGTWPGAVPYPDGGPAAVPQHVCRYNYNASVSARDLTEYFLPAWHAVITRGGALGMMCSYVSTNGVPSCANSWAINELARGEWGFSGYVVSDCLALQVMIQAHGYAADIPEAAALALNAGVSYNCGCVLQNGTQDALNRGLTNMTVVDRAITDILTVLYKLGEFDMDVPYRQYGRERLDSPAHRALAQASAAQGLVLLTNLNSTLPLSPKTQSIAFIGPNSNDPSVLQSSYGGDCDLCNDHTPLLAARAAGWNVTHAHGCDVNSLDRSGFPAAVAAASAADVAVLFLGFDFGWESEWGNGPDAQNDRPNITLPGQQEALLAAVVATGTRVVVVLLNGGAVGVERWVNNVGAVVEAFAPGELGGDAVVDALSGVTNAWGALPFTMFTDAQVTSRAYYHNESAGLTYDGGATHAY